MIEEKNLITKLKNEFESVQLEAFGFLKYRVKLINYKYYVDALTESKLIIKTSLSCANDEKIIKYLKTRIKDIKKYINQG